VHPELTDDAIELLSQLWNVLRQRDQQEKTTSIKKVLPITIRSFETLIRLSTAHAKLHTSKEIQIRDCVEAFRLMIYCLEGDSNALDGDLREILRKMGLDDGLFFERVDDKHKGHKVGKKEVKKMEEESKGIIQKMSKIDINKDEREAEAFIKLAMSS
jgi:DNA replication licensing factor MCM3